MKNKNLKVREISDGEWFFTENIFLDVYAKYIGATCTSIYFVLCRYSNEKDQSCFPSQQKIAEMLHLTDRTVRDCLKTLEKCGFIKIERKPRRKSGNWWRNQYWLLHKSAWLTPEEIVSYGYGRKQKTEPEEEKDINTEKQFPTNNTQNKNTNNNNTNNATPELNYETITGIVEKFSLVNPNYEKLVKNNSQRKIIERLIRKLGFEKILELVDILPKVSHEKYCPIITTPYELEKNLAHFLIYLRKNETKKIFYPSVDTI